MSRVILWGCHHDTASGVFFDFSKFFKVVREEVSAHTLTTLSINPPSYAEGWLFFDQLK